jgi:Flp pilus assembly pilin Flp
MWVEGTGRLRDCKGQGTTEYAILVGVLVVVAIIAVVAFRGKLQELWNAISENINNL